MGDDFVGSGHALSVGIVFICVCKNAKSFITILQVFMFLKKQQQLPGCLRIGCFITMYWELWDPGMGHIVPFDFFTSCWCLILCHLITKQGLSIQLSWYGKKGICLLVYVGMCSFCCYINEIVYCKYLN